MAELIGGDEVKWRRAEHGSARPSYTTFFQKGPKGPLTLTGLPPLVPEEVGRAQRAYDSCHRSHSKLEAD